MLMRAAALAYSVLIAQARASKALALSRALSLSKLVRRDAQRAAPPAAFNMEAGSAAVRPKATYAAMVSAALTALRDRQGSSRPRIRTWISREWGLPGLLVSQSREWKLLNNALKKDQFIQVQGKFKLRARDLGRVHAAEAGSAVATAPAGRKRQRTRPAAAPAAATPDAPPFWLQDPRSPPASIVFSSGARTTHPGPWFSTRAAGLAAVNRHVSANVGLLGGTAEITFELGAGCPNKSTLLKGLCPDIRVTPRSVAGGGVEAWCKTGEFSGQMPVPAGQLVALSRLLRAVAEDTIFPTVLWASEWLHALHSLVVLDDSPWKAPLVRVICPAMSLPANGERILTLRLHVYFHRLLFYLIAYEPLQTVLAQLHQPAAPVCPCHQPAFGAPVYSVAQLDDAEHFSLEGLLRSQVPTQRPYRTVIHLSACFTAVMAAGARRKLASATASPAVRA